MGPWNRIGRWTDLHGLAVAWAFYLGPLVVVWSLWPDIAPAWGILVFPLIVTTGWLTPWWAGASALASASVLWALMPGAVPDLGISIASWSLDSGIALFAVGLLLLAIGRALRWGWSIALRSSRSADEAQRAAQRVEAHALFMRSAAHELGNPLAAMRFQLGAFGAIAVRDGHKSLDVGIRRLERVTERLERLSRDMRDAGVSLLGAFSVERKDTDVSNLVHDLCATAAPVAESEGITLASTVPAGVHADVDSERLNQAVWNMIRNATRYTGPGGTIEVRLDETPDQVVVEVQDTGIGMDEAQLSQLFRPFERLHPDHPAKGTGLGLCIAQGIAEAHGGNITATSPGPGLGSTFRIAIARKMDEAPLGASPLATIKPQTTV